MSAPIVPALIPVSEVAVKQAAETLLFSPEFHLDVVDGVFVPSMSWPIDPAGDPLTVKPWLDQYTLEVDLMVTDPLTQASEWVVAGADMLVFHAETVELASLRDFVEFTTVSVGVSVNGATTTETLLQYAEVADYVQLMGIYEIGAQGQPFYEGIFDQLAAVKAAFPDMMVSVDGSVNAETITRLYEAGADRFICGSAIVKQPDPAAAHAALAALINWR